MIPPETIIAQTKKWIIDVVIGCNFCPFAAKEIKNNSVLYEVLPADIPKFLKTLAGGFLQMDNDEKIETILFILPEGYKTFTDYLKLLHLAEDLIVLEKMEGIYQLASFHPLYLFEGSNEVDAANYTNRSPYPIIQILRESSITTATDQYLADIPKRNIAYAEKLGLTHLQALRNSCFE
ncbi:MAG: DUF1415 domain-containing protein [Ferruginibacter sp.]